MKRGSDVPLGAALSLALACGLYGFSWGLPGVARRNVLPPALQSSPEFAQRLSETWTRLYRQIDASHRAMEAEEPVTYARGVEEFPRGWDFPPDALINSYRSFFLQSNNPDEKKSFIILAQMRPWKFEFKPLYVQYGGAFIYPLGAFLAAAQALGAARLAPDIAHYVSYPEDMRRLYLCGRAFILLFQLGGVWMLFDMGRRLSGWKTGLAAAALFTLCPMIINNSHLIKPHPYAAFWALAAARRMMLARERGGRADYWLCGLFAGIAVGASFTLVFWAALPVLAWADRRLEGRARAAEPAWAAGAAALALAVCGLLNPYLIFSFKNFAWELLVYAAPKTNAASGGLPLSLLKEAAAGMGVVPAFVAGAGTLAALARPGARRLLAVAIFGCGLVLWARLGVENVFRLYYPLPALADLLGADLVLSLPRGFRAALLALAFTEGFCNAGVCLENMRLDDRASGTRGRAAAWIAAHVPPASRLGLVRYPEPAHTPLLRYDLYDLVVFDGARLFAAADAPDYIVVDDQGRSVVDKLAPNTYDRAVEFLPFQAARSRFLDHSSFANPGIFIYRRRTPSPRRA